MIGLDTETKKKSLFVPIALIAIATVLSGLFAAFHKPSSPSAEGICPILPIKAPDSFYKDNSTVLSILHDEQFRLTSAEKLSKAIQIDTVVFDNPPEPADEPEYWTKFAKFHQYLEDTFPTVHKHLKLTKVNTWGLVYVWEGSDADLKPILLTAHQDTVPVQQDSLDGWTHSPFEGYFDGKYMFGRGSSDCKNLLVGIMETLELLISKQFKPQRTIIAAFGFDEESGGVVGARHISEYLQETYGENSIYALIDEGFGFDNSTGAVVASPMVGEKGYTNINAQLRTPGGHSSVPPDHTSIGIASELVYLLENNPFEPILTPINPVLSLLQCVAANHGDLLPKDYRDAILKADYDAKSNKKVVDTLQADRSTRYWVRTSQAIDIIKGGEKANALPESVFVSINHRIAVESSIKETVDRFMVYANIIAKKYDLGIELEDETVIDPAGKYGVLKVSIDANHVEPAEVSPTNDRVWEYLAGASRHLMEDLVAPDLGYELVVAPMLMTANTDTRHYHPLTKNIFRYTPGLGEVANIHSIDEYAEFDYHLQVIAFFYEYLQLIDSKDADN